jgi:hypothetical protein
MTLPKSRGHNRTQSILPDSSALLPTVEQANRASRRRIKDEVYPLTGQLPVFEEDLDSGTQQSRDSFKNNSSNATCLCHSPVQTYVANTDCSLLNFATRIVLF